MPTDVSWNAEVSLRNLSGFLTKTEFLLQCCRRSSSAVFRAAKLSRAVFLCAEPHSGGVGRSNAAGLDVLKPDFERLKEEFLQSS